MLKPLKKLDKFLQQMKAKMDETVEVIEFQELNSDQRKEMVNASGATRPIGDGAQALACETPGSIVSQFQ